MNSTTTTILGPMPVPIQINSIGASVNTGIVCDAIRNGYTDRSSNRDQNIAVAIRQAKVIETANPIRISCAVTDAWRRNSEGLSTNSARINETGGRIQVWTSSTRTKTSHSTSPSAASTIADPQSRPNERALTANVRSAESSLTKSDVKTESGESCRVLAVMVKIKLRKCRLMRIAAAISNRRKWVRAPRRRDEDGAGQHLNRARFAPDATTSPSRDPPASTPLRRRA